MKRTSVGLLFALVFALGGCSEDIGGFPADPASEAGGLAENITTDGSVTEDQAVAALASIPQDIVARSPRIFMALAEGDVIAKIYDPGGAEAVYYRYRRFLDQAETLASVEYDVKGDIKLYDATGLPLVIGDGSTAKILDTWVMCMIFLVDLVDCAANPHPGCIASAYYYDLLDC